ncbi:class II aldolase/adducin family protein [Paenisporosarcina indica]|uniref:class II aldolase/adducin family protein n=1 Tax=Paenisporosarcina indica TaxID=650093 RepID=UPI00094F7748|nr:class II aldolase/adducin family protein [Paenisporosarcina indica]
MNISQISEEIVKLGKELTDKGLVNGTGGNLSVRMENVVISTPSGWSLGELKSASLSITNLEGITLYGPKPTKELPMHLAIYHARPDINAVVHTHSIYAVTYSCTATVDSLIPIYIPSIAAKVGNVKLIPFVLPGSKDLGELVGKEIRQYNGLLLENHGVISAGKTLSKAGIGAYEIEDNLKIEFLSNHTARRIPNQLVKEIIETYGG